MVDIFTKWPNILKCKQPTTSITITYLRELFEKLEVTDSVVTDNKTQFTSSEF